LVFEVEGRLQIRPNQHALAQTLLAGGPDGCGPIAQLNMGEGKTRVILPMMILELADARNLVRCSTNRLQDCSHAACLHVVLHKLVLSTFKICSDPIVRQRHQRAAHTAELALL
jgi:hypothetical protein